MRKEKSIYQPPELTVVALLTRQGILAGSIGDGGGSHGGGGEPHSGARGFDFDDEEGEEDY